MIGAVRSWLTAIAAVSLLLSVAQMLTPKGPLREAVSFIGGLLLLFSMVQPLLRLDTQTLLPDISAYQQAANARKEELTAAQNEELRKLIESGSEAYILDKAKELGVAVQVRVTAEREDGETFVPVRAELTGAWSQELAQWMETELGLSRERQVWNER